MEHKFILLGIFITFFPVNVRKLTLDIFEYEKVTLVTLGGGQAYFGKTPKFSRFLIMMPFLNQPE